MVVWLKEEHKIRILEVACTWESLVELREEEKERNYAELAADLVNQNPGYQVTVHPVVVDTMGLVVGLRHYLQDSGLFPQKLLTNLPGTSRGAGGNLQYCQNTQATPRSPQRWSTVRQRCSGDAHEMPVTDDKEETNKGPERATPEHDQYVMRNANELENTLRGEKFW